MTRPRTTDDRAVLAFIIAERTRTGLTPSHREIAAACGLSSTSVVACALERLCAAGLLRQVGERASRGWVPTAERRVYGEGTPQ